MTIINIYVQELTLAICETFYDEIISVAEEVASARSAGVLTESEYERALVSADASLRVALARHIGDNPSSSISNDRSIPTIIEYAFIGSQRKYYGREHTIAESLHEALKSLVLADVMRPLNAELSDKHTQESTGIIAQLNTILSIKRPPMV